MISSSNTPYRKLLIAGAVVSAILIAVGTYLLFFKGDGAKDDMSDQAPVRRKISEPVNQIAVDERPYILLEPKADGRNLDITAVEVKKEAMSMEFELEYQAGSLLQGAFGLVELDTLPATTEIMFGSCSAGGACTFHTDIQGGTLLVRFEGGADKYALKQDWRYFDNADRETQIASKDAKFQMEADGLASQRYMVVYNSPGYPGELTEFGTLVSDIYTVTSSSALTGEAAITIRATEAGNLTILGYDGENWKAYETTTDEKTATATGPLAEAYVVVNQN